MFYLTTRTLLAPLARAMLRPSVEGAENVPRRGGVILASNHLSFADSVVIPMVAPRPVVFLAKADYFTGTGVKGFASRAWFTSMGMIPVERDDSKAAAGSLDTALGVLRAGDAFGIYPEGTRSRDGQLHRGHTGVAFLALTAKVPVVPVGLIGTNDLQPIGSRRPRPAKVTVKFGRPIDFTSRFDGVPAGRARREATDEIMAAIAILSGQPSSGTYNSLPPAT